MILSFLCCVNMMGWTEINRLCIRQGRDARMCYHERRIIVFISGRLFWPLDYTHRSILFE